MINYKIFLIALMCMAYGNLHAIIYGSDSAVSVQSAVTFPEADTNNTMLGFGSFASGFTLGSMSTTCTFNDFFPVGGTIALNGGTLYLLEDLVLSAGAQIYAAGTINANNHAIICENISSGTSFTAQYSLSLVTSNSFRIYGINSIDWSYDDKYIVLSYSAGQQTNVCRYVGAQLINNVTFTTVYDNVCCRWHPTQYYVALNAVALALDYEGISVCYFNPTAETLSTVTAMMTSPVSTYAFSRDLAWNSTGTFLLVSDGKQTSVTIYSFNQTTSNLSLAASHTIYNVNAGGKFSYGLFNNLSWSPDDRYFAVTSSDTSHALTIYSFDGATITEIVSTAYPHLPRCVDWSPTGSFIAVGINDYGVNHSDWFCIYRFTPPATLTQELIYSGASGVVTNLSWDRTGVRLAAGVTTGSLPYLNIYSFNPAMLTVTSLASLGVPTAITALDWAHSDSSILVAGATSFVSVYQLTLSTPHNQLYKQTALQFSKDTYLDAPLLFQGANVLDGHNRNLYLGSLGGIIVDSGASLLLKDLTIYNVSGDNISCVDNTSTLSCYNVTWSLDSDMTFSQGQLAIVDQLLMRGASKFIYQSDQTSTIYDHGNWYFDIGMTFSYAPISGANNLIAFENNSSILYLNGTNLYAPSTGLHFTKGCLMIEGPCQFISDGTDETNGIWVGDGDPANDMKLKILSESGIITGKGYVSYKNSN